MEEEPLNGFTGFAAQAGLRAGERQRGTYARRNGRAGRPAGFRG